MSTKLSSDIENQYVNRGWATVSGFFEPSYIERLRLASKIVWDSSPPEERLQRRKSTDGKVLTDRIDPATGLSKTLDQAAENHELLIFLSSLLGWTPRLFKMKLISKWPKSGGYGLHRDYDYWHTKAPPRKLMTAVIVMSEFHLNSGGIEFFSLEDMGKISTHSKDLVNNGAKGTVPNCVPGDLIIFQSLTPHQSSANYSNSPREALFLSYGDISLGDLTTSYYRSRNPNWINPD